MDFYAMLDQVVHLLRERKRVSYRALKEQLGIDDDRLEAIRAELLYAHVDHIREEAHGLAWEAGHQGERRQLTMFFCDLVGSTQLASRYDPEDWRTIVGSYYDACAKVIARFDGHIAQYLGDGLLVYFGYPTAHEDDAQRAVRAGLGIIEAIRQLNVSLSENHGISLAVRIGCHTGLVVVGDEVAGTGHDDMVLGDTPNIAARLESVAEPNTVVIGPLTFRLVGGFFDCRAIGSPALKGVAAPVTVYEVLRESNARNRLEALGTANLTPLVGRSHEIRLLAEHWTQAVNGRGHAVLISGEAGIGKSRLVHSLMKHVAGEGAWLTPCQASPYHRDTALYPVVDLFERAVLRSEEPASAADKLRQLETFFLQSGLPLEDDLAPLCSLLHLPPPAGHEFAELPPDQQKQQTMLALQSILRRRADRQPVLFVVEDLHWVDPTTVEFLTALIDQIADARILALFTARPEFANPWAGHPNLTEIGLARLLPSEAEEVIRRVADGKDIPAEIVADVVRKTDGVPLFIEELTKALLESGLLIVRADRYELTGPLPPLAIPNTLHDSLMARLDRLSAIKALAQLGATIGREFSFALLRMVSPWSEDVLHHGLGQLVTAEFLHQQGTPPQATYRFKHALIQDAAYQSLLKSTRQQHHQRIAAAIESTLPETVQTQPEMLAHHYTEAGLLENAVPYWLTAARRALQRHANQEASNHAKRGLELVGSLPDTPQRAVHELALHQVLGPAQSFVTGPHSVEHIHARAYELAQQVGDDSALFPALSGLAYAAILRGQLPEARALATEFLELAERQSDALVLAAGHWMLAYVAWWQGDVVEVLEHSRSCLDFYEPDQHRTGVAAYNQNPGIVSGYLNALSKWVLGYPNQACHVMELTLEHAKELQHPYSIGIVLLFSAQLAQLRREPEPALARAEEAFGLAVENESAALALWCLLPRGWARTQQGEVAAGIADICESMDRRRAFGMGAVWPWYLAVIAEIYVQAGDLAAAEHSLNEAMAWVQRNDERLYLAEVHRIRGELLLRRPTPDPVSAEKCFEQALAVARDQQAKSWELRAATSLCRMWLQQNRFDEACRLLPPIYSWFTEGLDTTDLQDAKAILEQL